MRPRAPERKTCTDRLRFLNKTGFPTWHV